MTHLMMTRAFENGAYVAPCNSIGNLSMPDGDAFRLLGDAGVSGGAEQRVAQGRGRNRPAQGMLPAARSNHQNLHDAPLLHREPLVS